MPRKRLYRSNRFPYHVTARANNREEFPGDLQQIWRLLTNELYLQCLLHGAQVHAFVLMPNHFHLLLSTPLSPIDEVMRNFLSSGTRVIQIRSNRSGHLFGRRYHWSLIRDPLYFAHALKYVYRNPVKAELVDRVENYRFSTFSGLMGLAPLPLRIFSPAPHLASHVPSSLSGLESWLNQPHHAEEAQAIQRALRRKEFKLPVVRSTRRPFTLAEIDAPPPPKGSDTKWWAQP